MEDTTTTNNNNRNDSGNRVGRDAGDDRFFRQFAAEIATALREQEDAAATATAPPSSSRSSTRSQSLQTMDTAVHDLYRALVFDEPLLNRIPNLAVVAAALGRQLSMDKSSLIPTASSPSSQSTSYALSNRLVNGILYVCQSHNSNHTKSNSHNKNNSSGTRGKVRNGNGEMTSNDDNNNNIDNDDGAIDNLSLLTTNGNDDVESTRVAMAKLAFCVLLDIPLQCCQCSAGDMKTVGQYLGSYKGRTLLAVPSGCPVTADKIAGENDREMTINGETQPPAEDPETASDLHQAVTLTTTDNAGEEEEEVWAAESDPSDYDFGGPDDDDNNNNNNNDDDVPSHQQQNDLMSQLWQESDAWLDPQVLSRPDPDLTLSQVTEAMANLLMLANYTLLEPLFSSRQSKKEETMQFTSRLTQLVLTMLQPDEPKPSAAASSSSNISQRQPQPTIIGRMMMDQNLDHAILSPLWILRDAATYHPEHVPRYLETLQTLLAVDQAYLQQAGAQYNDKNRDLCVASIVGFSSLSSWCLVAADSNPTKNGTLMTVTINAIVDSMNHLAHIVERVSSLVLAGNLHRDRLPMTLVPLLETLSGIWYNHAGPVPVSRTPIAQTLLNSGLLRQILLLAEPKVDADDDTKSLQRPLHHALWGLCVAYPKVVGKYVFRFPGTTQLVRQYVVQQNGISAQDCVECFLWNMFGWIQCTEAPTAAAATKSSSKVVWKNGNTALQGQTASTALSVDECFEVCEKAWARLCQLVEESLREVSTSTSNDVAKRALDEWGRLLVFARIPSVSTCFQELIDSSLLQNVGTTLLSLPRVEEEPTRYAGAKAKQEDEGDSDFDDVDGRNKHRASHREQINGHAHRLLKEYKLLLQGSNVGSSKTD